MILGAGHNGLVAAAYLARAGFEVLVAERNEEVGGAIASGEITLPGYVHDLYATNMNLFLGSPAFAELGEELAAAKRPTPSASSPSSRPTPPTASSSGPSSLPTSRPPTPNLVGGDSVGGSHRLFQNALFRPAPGLSNYRLPSPAY